MDTIINWILNIISGIWDITVNYVSNLDDKTVEEIMIGVVVVTLVMAWFSIDNID